jgi:hypothetical protein
MELVWLAVSITMLAGPNSDGTPGLNVVPQRYYQSEAECNAWRKDRYDNPWGVVDPVTGRIVSAYYYDCAPQSSKGLIDKIKAFSD